MPKREPPSFDQWIKQDFPKVRAAYIQKRKSTPGDEWAAFQTMRYLSGWIGNGEYWPVERLIAEETVGNTKQEDYPQP